MESSLKKGMMNVLLANIISLMFSLLTNFILPKYLSIDSYSAIKTFQLYIVYIGILHFGYEDGMYLKYGGKNIKELNGKDIATNLFTLRIFQIGVTICMVVIAIILKDKIFLAFSFAILPINLVAYFKLLFQAIGEFSKYGRVMNVTSIVTFIINATLVFGIQTDNYVLFLIAYVIWDIILWIGLEIYLRNKLPSGKNYRKFSFTEMEKNIRMGLPLTLGNFSSVLLTSIDRWFVKLLMSTLAFAQYSFAVSTESFMNVALTPIIITLYNYFCNHNDLNQIKRIRNCVMIFASFVVSCSFGAKFIMENYLQKYIEASNVLFFLFAAQVCYVVIKGVYVNIYKAQKRQKEYFVNIIIVVISGIIFNAICYAIVQCKEAFALGTLLSAFTWLILCWKDFPELRFGINENVYLVVVITSFLFCGIFLNSIVGFFVYIIITFIFSYLLMRNELYYLLSNLTSIFHKRGSTY